MRRSRKLRRTAEYRGSYVHNLQWALSPGSESLNNVSFRCHAITFENKLKRYTLRDTFQLAHRNPFFSFKSNVWAAAYGGENAVYAAVHKDHFGIARYEFLDLLQGYPSSGVSWHRGEVRSILGEHYLWVSNWHDWSDKWRSWMMWNSYEFPLISHLQMMWLFSHTATEDFCTWHEKSHTTFYFENI